MDTQIIQETEKNIEVAAPEMTWMRPIIHTIKTLARIGESIQFHQNRPIPDELAIEQWQEVHADLTRQLVEMLAELGVKLQVPDEELALA